VLDHTYSNTAFHEERINVNALVAGHYGVSVILVAGDDKLREEVLRRIPCAEYAVAERSLSRISAVMEPLQEFFLKGPQGGC